MDSRRAHHLVRRTAPDRRPLPARARGERGSPRGPDERGGLGPEPPREPLRAQLREAVGGLPADPRPRRQAAAVRGVLALQLDLRERPPAGGRARAAAGWHAVPALARDAAARLAAGTAPAAAPA